MPKNYFEDTSESPLEAAAGAAGSQATEAFALVASETRLAILLALWEAYDRPDAEDNAVSFSTLFERVDYDDAGNFRYHLDRLEDQFIRKRDVGDGYELRHTGLKLVQTVIGGAGVAETEREPAEIDRDCELCGAPTAVCYEDGLVFHVCTECAGKTAGPAFPDGFLQSVALHPAGVTDRTPDELIAAADSAAYRQIRTMFQGLCGTCSGPVNGWLDRCSAHDSDGICDNCGRNDPVWACFQCRVCKDAHAAPPAVLCAFHPAVIAFYYEHGVTTRWHAAEFDDRPYVGEHDPEYDREIVEEDPPQVAVTITLRGDAIQVTFDETATITDVCW